MASLPGRGPTPLPRWLGAVFVVVWIAASLFALLQVAIGDGPALDGSVDQLVDAVDRESSKVSFLVVVLDEPSAATSGNSSQDPLQDPSQDLAENPTGNDTSAAPEAHDAQGQLILDDAAGRIAEQLPDARIFAAPPSNAVVDWTDRHGLYLVPPERLVELAAHLEPLAVDQAAADLRAMLSSPVYGVSGSTIREDPLGLRALISARGGAQGFVADPDPLAPLVTLSGDLLAADGRSLLIALRDTHPAGILQARVRGALHGLPVHVVYLGREQQRHATALRLLQRTPRLLIAAIGALLIALGLSLRRALPSLLLILGLSSVLVVGVAVLGVPLGLLSVPLLVALLGMSAELGLALHPMSTRGWPSALLWCVALVPLLALPYGYWHALALPWALTMAFAVLAMRGAVPTLLELLGSNAEWEGQGFLLAPMPLMSLLICAGLLGGGVFAASQTAYLPVDRLALLDQSQQPALEERQKAMRDFFDPADRVYTCSVGKDAIQALDRSATGASTLATLVPDFARRVDSPGSYVLQASRAQTHFDKLLELELPAKMTRLAAALEGQGLRPDAFGEFLRPAADLRSIPVASAALAGPLGPWIEQSAVKHPEGICVRSVVELVQRSDHALPGESDALEFGLSGPRIAGLRDEARYPQRAILLVVVTLWLVAFVVWLGTWNMPIALSAGLAAVCSQCALVVILVALRQPVGMHVAPAFVLVAIAAAIAAGRSCKAVDDNAPQLGGGVLVSGICQCSVGAALLTTGEPLWQLWGIVLTCGCAIAAGIGIFAAPGMCWLMRRLVGLPTPALWDETEDEE